MLIPKKIISQNKNSKIASYYASITLCLISILFMSIVTFAIYQYNNDQNMKQLDLDQTMELDQITSEIQSYFRYSLNSIQVYSNLEVVKSYLKNPETQSSRWLKDSFINTSKMANTFQQIRLLNNQGVEVLRVDNDLAGTVNLIPDELLQDKSNRYYVQETFKNISYNFYLTPLDLNIERGKVEIPYNPVVRVSSNVYDNENILGLVMYNISGEKIFDLVEEKKIHPEDNIYILNKDGYYIYHPDMNKSFTFMFPERENEGYFSDYPENWEKILAGECLCVEGPSRTYVSKMKLISHYNVNADNNTYYIIMEVPPSTVDAANHDLTVSLLFSLSLLAPLLLVGSWVLGSQLTKNHYFKETLLQMATKDELTGLYNRRMIYERLKELIDLGHRSDMGITTVFIDINFLKTVNDTLGHEMGDKMIQSAAKALSSAIRSTDLAARLGGDEFLLVLIDCPKKDVINIITRVQNLFKSDGLVIANMEWTLSYGVSEYKDGDTIDTLVDRADALMYDHKRSSRKEA